MLVYMAMFYGFGLPVLFFIILICFLISYFVDKLAVAWYHRKPPMYDDTLSVNAVYIMKWAGFIHLAVSYWFLSNR